jgi:hypothetical protein
MLQPSKQLKKTAHQLVSSETETFFGYKPIQRFP